MTTEFTNEHHEILFALFILEANRLNRFFYEGILEQQIVHYVIFNYLLIWEDRAICEPEYEGWVTRMSFNDYEIDEELEKLK